jgi:coatomer subunit gamma
VRKRLVTNFAQEWDAIGEEHQNTETFALSTMKDLQAAVNEIIEFFGMQPVDHSESVPAKRAKHILYLAGIFLGNIPVLVCVL